MHNPVSRRRFLARVGAFGGSAAVYQAAIGLGLVPARSLAAPLAGLQRLRDGQRRSVVILGAGLSGLACAYELERAGYDCTLIEASHRIGGRVLTLRGGDLVDEMGNPQTCRFDDHPGLYFNAGPARIPAHHRLVHHYCKALGVPLEVFVNENYHAWVQDPNAFGGKPVRMRELMADARGFMTELIAKSPNRAQFDEPFSAADAERLFEFLRIYGDLDAKGRYRGSARAGHASGGWLEAPTLKAPLDFRQILNAKFWREAMHWGELSDQAAPMMQVVGGSDNLIKGFAAQLKSPILTRAPVQAINLAEDGVSVIYSQRGENQALRADYCLNNIPAHLLAGIHNNFPAPYFAALGLVYWDKLMKIAFQMSKRFWEEEGIYGGISWTGQEIEQIWYPSHGHNGAKGIVVGAYTFEAETTQAFARLTPAERLQRAIEQGAAIHPKYASYVENGVSVPWNRMNHMMGCGNFGTDEDRKRWFKTLQSPAGRHYLMGDQISYHPGWQEGALSSAHFALAHINERAKAEANGDA